MKFDKHTLWMIIGCGLPLLLIFFAPALGIDNSVSIFIFIVAMFAFHLLMPMHQHGHGGHGHEKNNESDNVKEQTIKTKNHEHH